jgi:hypothetical protein
MVRRLRFTTALLIAASVGGVASLIGQQACTTDQPGVLLGGGGGDEGAGGNADAGDPGKGKALFGELETSLVAACGTCHDAGGIADTPFLAGPDRYKSMSSWPGFVTKDPTQSKLETYPFQGSKHVGKNLDSDDLKTTLFPKIKAWLEAESTSIDTSAVSDAGPQIPPFAPILGFNAVYLDALGSEFKGMAITFSADELTPKSLELSDIQVHPTSTLGAHLVHPLFVVLKPGQMADPDPIDSFSNLDEYVTADHAEALGPGTLVLTNWKEGARMTIAFEKIEKYSTTPVMDDAGVTGGCADVMTFKKDAQGPLSSNCFGCHGGANPNAIGAVDMSKLMTDPAAACAQIKNRINPMTPAKSQLFVTTDPGGNAAHPYKFQGDSGKFGSFKTALTPWIQAEK